MRCFDVSEALIQSVQGNSCSKTFGKIHKKLLWWNPFVTGLQTSHNNSEWLLLSFVLPLVVWVNVSYDFVLVDTFTSVGRWFTSDIW